MGNELTLPEISILKLTLSMVYHKNGLKFSCFVLFNGWDDPYHLNYIQNKAKVQSKSRRTKLHLFKYTIKAATEPFIYSILHISWILSQG